MIYRPKFIEGRSLDFREVEESDAEFIFKLRTDNELNKYISSVSDNIKDQVEFIRRYKAKDNEYYYVVQDKKGAAYGLVRLYNINFETGEFVPGSWLMKRDAPNHFSLESMLLIYDLAFKKLNLKHGILDVKKKNKRVLAGQERFGAEYLREDDLTVYLVITREKYFQVRERYKKFAKD